VPSTQAELTPTKTQEEEPIRLGWQLLFPMCGDVNHRGSSLPVGVSFCSMRPINEAPEAFVSPVGESLLTVGPGDDPDRLKLIVHEN
jgi:hypothetical protein